MLLSCYQNQYVEAGCDEAGRGCLAGPVVAAAVIFPTDYKHKLLNDSKQLSLAVRNQLREEIKRDAIAYSVAFSDVQTIDSINILKASFRAMHKALEHLKIQPKFIIVDGNRFPAFKKIQHKTIVKGDAKYLSIAAASILAKTERDDFMNTIHNEFPIYNWAKNKGYGTAAHRAAIIENGQCVHHRKSFVLKEMQPKLF